MLRRLVLVGFMVLVYPLGTPLLYYMLLRGSRHELDALRTNQLLRCDILAEARARRDGAANVAASLAAVVRRDGFATRDARCDDEIAR